MSIDFKKCSEEELWKYVASHLKRNGIDTILVGGAVVSIYSKGAYRSGDLDFVLASLFVKKLPEVMKEIGFHKASTRHYINPECKHLFVEFPSNFLQIGNDNNIKPEEFDVEGMKIKILSPTDCIKDRMASYIHFKSRDGLDQALLVALAHPFDIQKLKKWCVGEGGLAEFEDFLRGYKLLKA